MKPIIYLLWFLCFVNIVVGALAVKSGHVVAGVFDLGGVPFTAAFAALLARVDRWVDSE